MAKRNVPTKNYVILFGLIVLIICACFASYNLYGYYKDSKVKESPLANTNNVVVYDDLKNATVDITAADTFLVISYLQDEKVHENEKEIGKLLKKKNLIDNIMYLDVTELKNEENFIDDLNKTLKLENNLKIDAFPAVVFYKEGTPSYTYSSDDHILNSGDFEHIIDMYSLAS